MYNTRCTQYQRNNVRSTEYSVRNGAFAKPIRNAKLQRSTRSCWNPHGCATGQCKGHPETLADSCPGFNTKGMLGSLWAFALLLLYFQPRCWVRLLELMKFGFPKRTVWIHLRPQFYRGSDGNKASTGVQRLRGSAQTNQRVEFKPNIRHSEGLHQEKQMFGTKYSVGGPWLSFLFAPKHTISAVLEPQMLYRVSWIWLWRGLRDDQLCSTIHFCIYATPQYSVLQARQEGGQRLIAPFYRQLAVPIFKIWFSLIAGNITTPSC